MRLDKPPSWTPINLSGQLFFGETRRLLVDWHVVIVILPGTGHLLAICKPPNATTWSTIPLASLPQPSPTNYIFGIAVDLSKQTPVTVDGVARRLPVLVTLSSDGSIRSYQLSPPSKDYPECNVSLVAVDPGIIHLGLRPATTSVIQSNPSPAPAPAAHSPLLQSSTPIAGLFAKMGEQKASPTILAASTPLGSSLGGAQSAAPSSSSHSTAATPSSIFSAQPTASAGSGSVGTLQTTPKSILTQPQTSLPSVSSLTHDENSETADEIERMVIELDEELCDMLRLLAEKKELVEEKTATYKETRDVELTYKRPLDLLERTHGDSVLQKFEDLTIKLHKAKKLIAETKKLSV
ncbi:unnamed protein product, partial [Strongylus vulgaris]